jgi:hypothetical protein
VTSKADDHLAVRGHGVVVGAELRVVGVVGDVGDTGRESEEGREQDMELAHVETSSKSEAMCGACDSCGLEVVERPRLRNCFNN